jgi:hypothetical protein
MAVFVCHLLQEFSMNPRELDDFSGCAGIYRVEPYFTHAPIADRAAARPAVQKSLRPGYLTPPPRTQVEPIKAGGCLGGRGAIGAGQESDVLLRIGIAARPVMLPATLGKSVKGQVNGGSVFVSAEIRSQRVAKYRNVWCTLDT